ncbi:MAG TPA: glycosyltransferase family 39 protein [Drouetiella sp.]|jgi:4-amino-4-deoxy-L-arabinose transferase-like glycosyltransferase
MAGREKVLTLSLIFVALGLMMSLNLFGIVDPSEGFYAEAAREMLERRDIFTPYLNFQPFYEKPIGIYWLIMLSFKIFGVNEFAARLPGTLSALFCAAFTAHILMRLHLRRVGLFSALVLLTMPLYAFVARLSLTDMPLTACLSVALLSVFYFPYSAGNRSYLYIAYAALAFAVLLKGPLAVVLFSAIWLTQYLVSKKLCAPVAVVEGVAAPDSVARQAFSVKLKQFLPLQALAIICTIDLPWYIYETVHTRGAFFQEFFIRQHFSRLEGGLSHQEPWYFYLLVFALGTLPWTAFLSGLIGPLRKVSIGSDRIRPKLVRFCLVWMISTIVLFSLSSAKLATYIVPSAVPLAVVIGISMDYLIRLGKSFKIEVSAWIAALSMIVAAVLGAVVCKFRCDKDDLILVVLSLAVAPVLLLVARRQRLVSEKLYVAVAGLALGLTVSSAAALHCYDEARNRSLRRLYKSVASTPASVANFMRFVPGALFYVRKPVANLATVEDYLRFLRDTPAPHVVVAESRVSDLLETTCPGLKRVRSDGDYTVLQKF